jgi:tetratricopeptide (TPR) repeat protein
MAYDSLNKASVIERTNALDYAINLLDKATAIDTNYFYAYQNKFIFENELKQYKKAFITSKFLLNLRPQNIEVKIWVAGACERAGDSVSAVAYYKSALAAYSNILDTMSHKNLSFNTLKMEKATVMIMLNQQREGYGMLRELFTSETDPNLKQMYEGFMSMTRRDFLFGDFKKNTSYSNPVTKTY